LGAYLSQRSTWEPSASADDADSAEARLKKLGLELPKLSAPKGAILVPAVRVGELLYTSGHLPGQKEGKPIVGTLGKDMSIEDAQDAARRIAMITLAVVKNELGSLDKVVRLVKVLGMVRCTPEFIDQPKVINAFSEVLVKVFGEKAGKGARSAVGMASLPTGAPVEIECIFQVKS
jgi:enamine deaminase RidA (YjgF/YER057c/UK114 family)